MELQVIGAGISRTGTESLKKALEILGLGKCYHMWELIENPPHLAYWKQLLKNGNTDFERLFAGYQSAIDIPCCYYYPLLMEKYPGAKVILTTRDADSWYESARQTLMMCNMPGPVRRIFRLLGYASPRIRSFVELDQYIFDFMFCELFQGKAADPEACKSWFVQWNQQVIRQVPAHRLLVFQVSEGWQPLCNFLERPIPATPFPRGNNRQDFYKTLKHYFPFLIDPENVLKKSPIPSGKMIKT